MPIETDQQYLERVVKEQAEEIERLKVMLVGDRVKVVDQDIWGVIVRWDGADAVVLDDDRADWIEEDEEGTLILPLSELAKEG